LLTVFSPSFFSTAFGSEVVGKPGFASLFTSVFLSVAAGDAAGVAAGAVAVGDAVGLTGGVFVFGVAVPEQADANAAEAAKTVPRITCLLIVFPFAH